MPATIVNTDSGVRITPVAASDWAQVRPAWERLHAAAERPTFFLSPTWMDAWLDAFGPHLAPVFYCVATASDPLAQAGSATGAAGAANAAGAASAASDPIGIVLVATRKERQGPFSFRHGALNTAGEGADSPMLEHNDLLAAPEHRAKVLAAAQAIIDAAPWDTFTLGGIERHVQPALRNALPPNGDVDEAWCDAPYVDLEALRRTDTPWLASLSRNTRYQIRRSIARYTERGELRITAARTLDEARSWFAEMVQLHERLWRERGKPGAFRSTRLLAFHDRILALGHPRGEVELLRITAGDETVGILYNLRHGDHVSYYQSGFRYEEDNQLKPGLVCHALAIERSLAAGVREYDLLAAANSGARYKLSLANANREFGWVTVRRHSLRSRAAASLQELRGWVRERRR